MPRHIFSRFRYSPFLAQMVVIRRCNLSCGYCSEFDKTSDPVPLEILEKRLEKLKDLGTFGISLTGGEPTLHPELPRLIRKCRELRFFRTGMISNGFFLAAGIDREAERRRASGDANLDRRRAAQRDDGEGARQSEETSARPARARALSRHGERGDRGCSA